MLRMTYAVVRSDDEQHLVLNVRVDKTLFYLNLAGGPDDLKCSCWDHVISMAA